MKYTVCLWLNSPPLNFEGIYPLHHTTLREYSEDAISKSVTSSPIVQCSSHLCAPLPPPYSPDFEGIKCGSYLCGSNPLGGACDLVAQLFLPLLIKALGPGSLYQLLNLRDGRNHRFTWKQIQVSESFTDESIHSWHSNLKVYTVVLCKDQQFRFKF